MKHFKVSIALWIVLFVYIKKNIQKKRGGGGGGQISIVWLKADGFCSLQSWKMAQCFWKVSKDKLCNMIQDQRKFNKHEIEWKCGWSAR